MVRGIQNVLFHSDILDLFLSDNVPLVQDFNLPDYPVRQPVDRGADISHGKLSPGRRLFGIDNRREGAFTQDLAKCKVFWRSFPEFSRGALFVFFHSFTRTRRVLSTAPCANTGKRVNFNVFKSN